MKKIQDNFSDGRSAFDREFTEQNVKQLFKSWRSAAPVPKSLKDSGQLVEELTTKFGLRGVQFGEWLTNEDRYNYMLAMYAALYDMNKVFRFKTDNLGLSETLAIAFGSRGVPKALAHYEGTNCVINLARYKRHDRLLISMSKEWRFLNTGGAGSFGHEYGHFLDNAFGMYSDTSLFSSWLTGDPISTAKRSEEWDGRKNPLRAKTSEIMDAMLWDKKGNKTPFHLRIEQETEYYNRRTEMFARLIEVYISYTLKEKGIYNRFLVKTKYTRPVYLKNVELKPLLPLLEDLFKLMRERS